MHEKETGDGPLKTSPVESALVKTTLRRYKVPICSNSFD